MATDILEIFGSEYSGVTGIKATNSASQTLTYIRPEGTINITSNASGIDVTAFASANVSVSGGGSVLVVDTPDVHGGTVREITAQSAVTLQNSVTIMPSTSSQTISASSGYDGFRSAFVEAIPSEYVIPSGTLSISENGTYNVSAFASAEVLVSGGGGGDSKENEIIERTISGSYENSSVTTIGEYAFYYCSTLSAVSFPNATYIGEYAFYSCSRLSEAKLPNITSTIGSYAFNNCVALSEANFPNITTIGSYAFGGCAALREASFPNVTTIGSSAFYYCSTLSAVSFPNVTTIGTYAFSGCSTLSIVNFPKLTNIGNNAFNKCNALSEANFPNVTTIGSSAFYACNILSKASFPNATFIGNNAFRYCFVLTTAIFNNKTTASQSIYASVFGNCYNLISLYLLSSTSIYTLANINAFTSTPISTYTTSTGGVQGSIFVPEGIYNSYITATNWATYSARFVSLTSSQVQHVIDYGTHVM